MPLDDRLVPKAVPLYTELTRLIVASRSGVDYFFYNVGTGIALAASGAATVLSALQLSVWATSTAAIATFFIAISQNLGFRKRWIWGLERAIRYSCMIYRLNALVYLTNEPEIDQAILSIYDGMREERARDSDIPAGGGAA